MNSPRLGGPDPFPAPGPRPERGPDLDALRERFGDLLDDSTGGEDVSEAQVEALDSAHELLAEALASLDSRK